MSLKKYAHKYKKGMDVLCESKLPIILINNKAAAVIAKEKE